MQRAQPYDAYYRKLQGRCMLYLTEFGKTQSEEALHGLRVSIKKIKALLRFMKQCQSDFRYRHTYKPFKKIFRQAGKIREGHIHLKILQKSPRGFAAAMTAHKMNIHTEAGKFAAKTDKHKLIIKDVSPLYSTITKTQRGQYFKRRVEELRSEAQQLKGTKHLHDFRKQLKEVMYNTDLLNRLEKKQLGVDALLPLIDKTQDLIGKWHDTDLAIQTIREQVRKGGQATHEKYLNTLQQTADKQVRQIEKLLNQFNES